MLHKKYKVGIYMEGHIYSEYGKMGMGSLRYLENEIVCSPEDSAPTLDILIPIPISVNKVSTVSLVTLFFKSLVVT